MLELEIKPDGYQDFVALELNENFSLSIEDNNPLFATDIIEGTYSFPVTLPATPHNTRLLKFANDWHVSVAPVKQLSARIRKDGIIQSYGVVMLRSSGSKGFRINYQSRMSGLGDKLSMKLSELNHTQHELLSLSNIPYLIGADKEGVASGSIHGIVMPDGNRKWVRIRIKGLFSVFVTTVFTINEDEFKPVENTSYANTIVDSINASEKYRAFNEYYSTGQYLDFYIYQLNGDAKAPFEVTYSRTDGEERENELYDCYVPYWNSVLKPKINALFQHTVNSDFVCPTFRASNFWKDVGEVPYRMGPYQNIPNNTADGFLQWGDKSNDLFLRIFKFGIVPMYTLRYLLQRIEATTGIRIVVDWAKMPGFDQLIFFNTQSINSFVKPYNDTILGTYQDVINPAVHLPDMTVSSFFLELKKVFGQYIVFSIENNTLSIGATENAMKNQPAADWTLKTSPDYEQNYTENPGQKVGYKLEQDDVVEGITLERVVGSGLQDNRSKFSPLSFFFYKDIRKVPSTNLTGGWEQSKAKPINKILLYHGLHNDLLNKTYPFASTDNLSSSGEVIGPLSLDLEGDYGVYKLYLRKLVNMHLMGLQVSSTHYLSLLDLLNYHYTNIYRINQRNFLIKKISYVLNDKATIVAKAELVAAY